MEEITEKINQSVEKIKSLLEQMPDKRFDFKFEDDDYDNGVVVNEEEDLYLDICEFTIYSGGSWYLEDELIPTSVYLNDEGELMFDVHYRQYDSYGNFTESDDITEVTYSMIEHRNCNSIQQEGLADGLSNIIYVIENS